MKYFCFLLAIGVALPGENLLRETLAAAGGMGGETVERLFVGRLQAKEAWCVGWEDVSGHVSWVLRSVCIGPRRFWGRGGGAGSRAEQRQREKAVFRA